MSDYPLSEDERPAPAPPVARGKEQRRRDRLAAAAANDDSSEPHLDWDSAALVAPGGLSPARQLAMQRQHERLSSMTPSLGGGAK